MSAFKWFASFVLATTIVPALPADPHCPGNVASVPLQLTNSHQMIVAVSVNHSGPYNFLLDTGTQMTMVDPFLAAELHLNTQGSAGVAESDFLHPFPSRNSTCSKSAPMPSPIKRYLSLTSRIPMPSIATFFTVSSARILSANSIC